MCVCVRSVMRTLWDPMDRGWDFPGRNIGVGYHFLLQGLFPYMHLLGVLHWQADGLPLAPLGGLRKLILSSSDRCFPGSVLKKSACQCRRRGFHPWVQKTPWRRKWQPTPVFLPGESHGQRSLAGYSHKVTKSCT